VPQQAPIDKGFAQQQAYAENVKNTMLGMLPPGFDKLPAAWQTSVMSRLAGHFAQASGTNNFGQLQAGIQTTGMHEAGETERNINTVGGQVFGHELGLQGSLAQSEAQRLGHELQAKTSARAQDINASTPVPAGQELQMLPGFPVPQPVTTYAVRQGMPGAPTPTYTPIKDMQVQAQAQKIADSLKVGTATKHAAGTYKLGGKTVTFGSDGKVTKLE
jgi:hypothetical protein